MAKIIPPDELHSFIEEAATKAAQQAVEQMMLRIGVDPADDNALPRLKRDLEYLRVQHKNNIEARKVIRESASKVLTTAAAGALLWAFYIFKDGLHDAAVQWINSPTA